MEILRSHQSGSAIGRIASDQDGWTMPVRGTRVRGDVDVTHALMTQCLIAAADRFAVACDLTSAHLWSMVVPGGFGLDVDAQACAVATMRDGTRLQSRGVRGRRLELPPEHVTLLNGTPITTPARTWIDCAAFISWTDVVAMGDGLLRASLATRDDLSRMVAWGKGRRGIRAARWALPILDPHAESPAESWVRAHLIRAGIRPPACNPTVRIGNRRVRLDLAWLPEKVAVEYDGVEHHGPDRHLHDARRRDLLRRAGWEIVVIRKEDLATPGEFAAVVAQLLRSRQA
ncbi:MAG: hypothetical protein O2789_00865 [Actinomycetota bacterium]|nr:hypothetical protein [Actinomycetota bacterium]